MSRSWCIAGFVNIVGSYGVFPSLSCCDELSFSLWDFVVIDWILLWIWEHLIYILQLNTRGDNGVSYWFTWYVFWHSTCGFPRWHRGNLCIGVDARSRLLFLWWKSWGTLWSSLCWIEYYESAIIWCFFSTNTWIDRSERIASRWFRTLQTISSYVLR